MSNINSVCITGFLTRHPELRAAGASEVLAFGIGVNERHKNSQTDQWEDRPNFFEVLVWGARADPLSRILQKGTKVAIAGKLRFSSWTGNDGGKRSRVEIVAEEVDLMVKKEGEGLPHGVEAPMAMTPEELGEDIPF
jgi:single-strand DNA-binding protein